MRSMGRRRVVLVMLVVLLAALGVGCTGESGPSAVPSSGSPTATVLPEGAGPSPLEASVLAALRTEDPGADTSEHGFDDAWVEATIQGQNLTIHVAAPGISTPGKQTAVAEYSGVKARRVSTVGLGDVWRFECRLPDFGNRLVDVAFASEPAKVVPVVYRLLACVA